MPSSELFSGNAPDPTLSAVNTRAQSGAEVQSPFIDVGGATDQGRVRKLNEDCFFAADVQTTLELGPSSTALGDGVPWFRMHRAKLLAVADGISGAGGGAMASETAARTLAEYVTYAAPVLLSAPSHDDPTVVRTEVERALRLCQQRVRKGAAATGRGNVPVGTTMTFALIEWPRLYVVHVGDSRAYLFRNRRLLQLTSDDTVAQRLVERDVMSPEQAAQTPFRDVLVNAVGGDQDEIEVEFHHHELRPGDQLLLCTDGLNHQLSSAEIATVLAESAVASTACRRLIDAANEAGGEDNITAVVARVESEPNTAPRQESRS